MLTPAVTCTVSGLNPQLKEAVYRAGERLGITFTPTLDENSTHLVAMTVQSDKYRHAVRQELPVVTPEWVLRSADAGKLEPEVSFLLPPLYGLVIAVTGPGFDEETRERASQLIERLGGRMTRGLIAECTHLVAEAPCGEKFHACCTVVDLRNVQVVSCGWLDACARTGVCVDAAQYLMARREPCLSSCVLYVMRGSASDEELAELAEAARAVGATRVERLGRLVTHVLLGELACDNPTRWGSEVSGLNESAPAAAVLATDWLLECNRRGDYAPTDKYLWRSLLDSAQRQRQPPSAAAAPSRRQQSSAYGNARHQHERQGGKAEASLGSGRDGSRGEHMAAAAADIIFAERTCETVTVIHLNSF